MSQSTTTTGTAECRLGFTVDEMKAEMKRFRDVAVPGIPGA
jgi:hypothetical protein